VNFIRNYIRELKINLCDQHFRHAEGQRGIAFRGNPGYKCTATGPADIGKYEPCLGRCEIQWINNGRRDEYTIDIVFGRECIRYGKFNTGIRRCRVHQDVPVFRNLF
jgi:hypothetical protein